MTFRVLEYWPLRPSETTLILETSSESKARDTCFDLNRDTIPEGPQYCVETHG